MGSEYSSNGHEFVVMGYISSHPHSSINDVINSTGINTDSAFKALDELKKQGILIPDEKMEIVNSNDGLGLIQKRTYTVNPNHPNIDKKIIR